MSAASDDKWSDEKLDYILAELLRWGVLISAAVTLLGGIIHLWRTGMQPEPNFSKFPHAPAAPHNLAEVIAGVMAGRSTEIIELGILLLIATPVARVIYSVAAFALQRDWLYVVVTLIVLGVLAYSLTAGLMAA